MGPEKRATCKEVVEKLRFLYEKASFDEDYCLQAAPGQPKRVNTDLSTLSPHVFDPIKYARSSSQHRGIHEDQSKSLRVPGAAEDRGLTDEHKFQSTSRIEEADSRKWTPEAPRPRGSGGKTRLDHSPSTNRSSPRNTHAAGLKLPLRKEVGNERDEKGRGLRQILRSLLCW